MHYPILVLIDQPDRDLTEAYVREAIAETMTPLLQDDDDAESGGWWDGYQIGGRWSGLLDGFMPVRGYESWSALLERPREWVFVNRCDILPVSEMTNEQWRRFFGIVVHGEPYEEADKPELAVLRAQHSTKLAVVVDCHN